MGHSRGVASAREPYPTSPCRRPASARRRTLLAALLLITSALALSACGGGSSGSSSGSLTQPGLYGKLPAAGTATRGDSITFGVLNGNTVNYIFPIVPSGNASTYNYNVEQAMWLPLYNNSAYGSTPGIDYSLSLAKRAVFSDGNKTVSVTLNPGYKWSDGQPVIAKDVLFDIALIKAAVHESAANWASYTPGYFPDSLASITTSGKYTVVMHLKRAYNPGFFLNNQLALNLYALPSSAWNVTSPNGPHLDWTVPANAKKIYDYLGKAGGQVGNFGTNPLWKIVDGPFVLSSFSPVNASFTMNANPSYGGLPSPTSTRSRA